MGKENWFLDWGIIEQESAGQGFEGKHYFQSMCLHKKVFRTIFQTNVESIGEKFLNIGANVSSKLLE